MNRYGKKIDMRMIDRNLDNLKERIYDCHQLAIKNLNNRSVSKRKKCVVCNCEEYEEFVEVYGYMYYECLKCKSIFLSDLPDINKLYEGVPDKNIEGCYVNEEIFQKRIPIIAKPKVEYVLDVVNKYSKELNLWLDIGCGTGEILTAVNDFGLKAIGIESDKREVNFAREKGLEVIEDFFDYRNENKKILDALKNSSIVSFFNVLEHIEEPKLFMDHIAKYMSKESFLIFEVPMHPSLASFANLTSPTSSYRHIIPPEHLQIFTEKGIEMLLDDKFEILSRWGFGQGFCDIINNAMISSETRRKELYESFINISNQVQQVIDENGFSDAMIFIARRV